MMIDPSAILGRLDVGFDGDVNSWDFNGDGILDISDCPFPFGSTEAKVWWKDVLQPYTTTQITPEMKAKYGEHVVGAYHGKPLVPGQAGPGQGDFDYFRDKLVATQNVSYKTATKILGKVNKTLYGG